MTLVNKHLEAKPHSCDLTELYKKLESSNSGLSSNEAQLRLREYGANTLPSAKKISILEIVLRQIKNPFIYVLVFALLISILTQHLIDVGIISATILISAAIGCFQEYKADKSLQALKQIVKSKAKVLRDGVEQFVRKEELVFGDVICLKAGDKVLADARLIETSNLELDEAILTGESMPVSKITSNLDSAVVLADRRNMLYSGTSVVNGGAKALVVATGSNAEMGKIASLIKDTLEHDTPLQKQLMSFGKKLTLFLIVLNILIFTLGIIAKKDFYEMFLTSVALVVAAVPEGLVPAMSIILAIAMQRLVKKQALVRKMLAAETLGSVSVICTDKTGTLTTGEMVLSQTISSNENFQESDLIKVATLCNEANKSKADDSYNGNPTDKAILKASFQRGFDKEVLEVLEPRVAWINFSSHLKYMASLHQKDKMHVAYVKGAPETIISLSNLSDGEQKKLIVECEKIIGKGYRVIALAQNKNITIEAFQKKEFGDLEFLGFLALKDPLRAETKEALELCLKAGVKPLILTGDHKITALNIANDLGLDLKEEEILDGIKVDELSEKELRYWVSRVKLFARVEPRHKIRIVSALQENGEIVAMTGDGINDSPALKKADIGVAVGSGTDIAKETADLILLDDNFMTIVEAIRSGRLVFNNLRKVILCLLIDSFSEMFIVTGSILLSLPLPILPAQILWVKLLEDTFPAVSLSFEELDEDLMDNKPRAKDEPILNKNYIKLIAFYTLIMDSSLLVIFINLNNHFKDLSYARTIIFVCLGITTLVGIFSIRSIKYHFWQIDLFSNKLLLYTFALSLGLYFLAIYTPFFNKILQTVALDSFAWLLISVYGIASILVYELCKKITIMNEK